MTKNNLLLCCISAGFALAVAQAGNSATACWLDSYGRGVGTIPGRVADCPAGYTNFGLTCTSGLSSYSNPSMLGTCPSGFTNYGLFCKGTTWSTFWDFKTTGEMTCPAGYFLNKTIGRCYKDCKPGYKSVGEMCAAGLDTVGASAMTCRADEVKGGVANARCYPAVGDCGADGQKDAGLCYKKCSAGYNGVGPVCWGTCPSSLPYSCGASCTKDAAGCQSVIFSQVSSVGTLAGTIVTMGTASAVTAAAGTAVKAADTAADVAQTADKAADAATTLGAIKAQYDKMKAIYDNPSVQTAIKSAGAIKTGVTVLANSENLTAAEMVQKAAQIAAIVDTTGVSATIAAYSLPVCSTQFNELPKPPAKEVKVGFCMPANPEKSWYILKLVEKDGWIEGEQCHAMDGSVTAWGEKDCKGGSLEQCNLFLKDL